MKTYIMRSVDNSADMTKIRIDNDLAALIDYIIWNHDFTDQEMIIASLQKNMDSAKCKEDD